MKRITTIVALMVAASPLAFSQTTQRKSGQATTAGQTGVNAEQAALRENSDESAVIKAIQALSDQWGQANKAYAESKNKEALKSFAAQYATPDLTTSWLDGSGAKDRKQAIEQQVKSLSTIKKLNRYDVKIQKVTLTGKDTALADTLYDISWDETDSETGKTRRKEAKGKERDTWVNTPTGWRLKQVQELEALMFTDGKPDKPTPVKQKR